jgi:hypothetical protein
MARRPNSIKTVTITISTTEPVEQYLAKLVSTGLYGKNPAEAAERLVARSIEQLVRDGTLGERHRGR